MNSPTFDSSGDPTEETLAAIENWVPDFNDRSGPWTALMDYVKKTWNTDYGAIYEEQDEDGKPLICFVTGGWSANEGTQGAMDRHLLFRAMNWHSSYRGGLTKYALR